MFTWSCSAVQAEYNTDKKQQSKQRCDNVRPLHFWLADTLSPLGLDCRFPTLPTYPVAAHAWLCCVQIMLLAWPGVVVQFLLIALCAKYVFPYGQVAGSVEGTIGTLPAAAVHFQGCQLSALPVFVFDV